jgi:hypothetical protein
MSTKKKAPSSRQRLNYIDFRNGLCDPGHLVDAGDVQGEECVATVLDHLGSLQVHPQHRHHLALVKPIREFLQEIPGPLVELADDNAVRLRGVLYRSALPQELGTQLIGIPFFPVS